MQADWTGWAALVLHKPTSEAGQLHAVVSKLSHGIAEADRARPANSSGLVGRGRATARSLLDAGPGLPGPWSGRAQALSPAPQPTVRPQEIALKLWLVCLANAPHKLQGRGALHSSMGDTRRWC